MVNVAELTDDEAKQMEKSDRDFATRVEYLYHLTGYTNYRLQRSIVHFQKLEPEIAGTKAVIEILRDDYKKARKNKEPIMLELQVANLEIRTFHQHTVAAHGGEDCDIVLIPTENKDVCEPPSPTQHFQKAIRNDAHNH